MLRSNRTGMAIVLVGLIMVPALAQETPGELRPAIRESVESLSGVGKDVARAYAPFRRGASDDQESWSGLGTLFKAVVGVAEETGRVQQRVKSLADTPGFELSLPVWEFRQRQARADSLVALARAYGGRSWNEGLPTDPAEARLVVERRAREAKTVADHTVIAANDLAYAVGVTEGIGIRALSLSAVGVLVVFFVLALISVVVGAIRKLDDGWKLKEKVSEAAAFDKEPTIDTTTLVLISAACATVITGRFRVRKIRRLLSPRTKRTPWSAQGRLILQGSHSVSRKQT